MSSDTVVEAVLLAATCGVYIFAGYRAFRIRKALVGALYRSRALWSIVFAALFVPFVIAILPFNFSSGIPVLELDALGAFIIVFNFAAFVFCDRTILVARELDFFHRDTLGYGKVRWLVWTMSAVGMFGSLYGPSSGWVSYLFAILWPGPLAYFAVALAATSLRVPDRAIKSYSKWFGLFTGVIAISFLALTGGILPLVAGMLVASIFYYRATVSLSATSKLDLATLSPIPTDA